MKQLLDWGLTPDIQAQISESDLKSYTLGRIINEEKGGYKLITEAGIKPAQKSGRFEFRCIDERDLPTVGDWVLCFGDDMLMIDRMLARQSVLARRKTGSSSRSQVIAANLDVVFIVTSINTDLNIRRIERYLALARNGNIKPVIVLSKCDLGAAAHADTAVKTSLSGVDTVAVSAVSGDNMAALARMFTCGKTGALVGSSGVGKSTILNYLLQDDVQAVQDIREGDEKGRHTTTSRSMFILPAGGILIDTPGIREVGMTEDDEGANEVFYDLDALAATCRFSNCGHNEEPGCALIAATLDGSLDPERIKSWQKLQREQRRHEAARDARLMSELKKERKQFARMARNIQKKGQY